MRLVEIYSDYIWSACYEGEKVDAFNRLFRQWLDAEFLHNFYASHKRFLDGNIFFSGYTEKDVELNTFKEALNLRKDFKKFFKNAQKGIHPDFDDRFLVLNRNAQEDDLKREMYGHPKDDRQMTSVLRLYAIKLPSAQNKPPAYIITGGGIKLVDNNYQMKELKREMPLIDTVQNWLNRNKIETKEQLIDYLNRLNNNK